MRYQEEEERQGQKMPAVSVVFVAYIRTFERIVIQLFELFELAFYFIKGRGRGRRRGRGRGRGGGTRGRGRWLWKGESQCFQTEENHTTTTNNKQNNNQQPTKLLLFPFTTLTFWGPLMDFRVLQ